MLKQFTLRRHVVMAAALAGTSVSASAQFSTLNTQLLSNIPLSGFTGAPDNGNDCWGYVSPSGREYALMGLETSLAVVEVTNPASPVIVGQITHSASLWADVKVYQNYCYVSNETGGGIDVIDLSQVDNGVVTLVQRLTAGGLSTTHNVALNADSGYLYLCGSNVGGGRLLALSLANPANPVIAGQPTSTVSTYCHDAQIVTYTSGPYAGREIAFCCNGGTGVDILDVTNKASIFRLSRSTYPNLSYCHQGWLTEDRKHLFVNDETDTVNETVIFDVEDLSNPEIAGTYNSGIGATDHNLYLLGDFVFEADYRGGARIFCASDPHNPVQVGWFDTYPENDGAGYQGAWSVYPYLPSGVLLISDINRGLFVVDVTQALTQGALGFDIPNGPPELVSPAGGTMIQAEIVGACGAESEPISPRLHVDAGSGEVIIPMTQIAPNTYSAAFPSALCGDQVSYYISAQTSTGVTNYEPAGAPATPHIAVAATGVITKFTDDFESELGWVATNVGATAGLWQRGVPVNDPAWEYDPSADGDGSGQCWLTGNVLGNSDVDGGSVRLTSPALDLSGQNSELTFFYYLRLTDISGVDKMLVEMSSNGDAGPWQPVASFATNSGAGEQEHLESLWQNVHLHEDDIAAAGLNLTSNMKIRFTVNDGNPQSIVEAGIDGVEVRQYQCTPVGVPGDATGDGVVNIDDLLMVINSWGACASPCPADMTPTPGDGIVNIDDLLFVINNWG
jgi:choice-of-anchor B domain-containing protein